MSLLNSAATGLAAPADSERIRSIDLERIRFQDVVSLLVRAWPYVVPVRWHAVAYIAISVFTYVWEAFFTVVIYGLIYNNVLLNLPVSGIGALLLQLDPHRWVHVAHLGTPQRFELIGGVILLAIIATAIGQSIGHANDYYRMWIAQRVNQDLRLHLLGQLQSLSLKFHAESRAGDAVYRLLQDSAMVTQILQATIVDPFLAAVRFLLGVAVVAAMSPFLGLVVLLTWGPMIYVGARMSGPLRKGFKVARETNSALTSNIQETIEGIRTIKVNGLEAERQQLFEAQSTDALRAAHDARVRLMLFGFYTFVCGAVPLIFVELRAAYLAHEGAPTFLRDVLLSFGFAVWNLGGQDQARGRAKLAVSSSLGLIRLWGRAQDMAMGLNRVYQILDLVPDVQNRPDAIDFTGLRTGIRFTNVRFAYPERALFDDVSFTARAGSITALVGPTGSGKSTLMLLLLRMLEFQGGRIELDGQDIRCFTFQSIRRNITLATQENILFSLSVMENIRYARPEATDDQVRAAAAIACADEFIERLPEGYQTFLGERAGKLSSGQRQRLVIARAILKDTPILILDEPTASLDAVTEQRIMTNIKAWAKARTVFLITHRLSTIREADAIVFIQDGGVADSGTHAELMARPSAYRAFVSAELGAPAAAAE